MSKRVVCEWCGHSKSIAKDVDKAYQQGRADAIDKCIEIVKNYGGSSLITTELKARMRELKEQSND